MGWVWIDDKYAEHPKLVGLGVWCEPAGWLNLAAVGWCNRYLTDGVIPKQAVCRLALFRGMAIAGEPVTPEAVAEQLVAAGLWEDRGRSYVVHDFLRYQMSRADVLARRDRVRIRVRQSRDRARDRRRDSRERKRRERERRRLLTAAGERAADVTPMYAETTLSPTPTPTNKNPDARARALQTEGRARAQNGTPNRSATVPPAIRRPPRRVEPEIERTGPPARPLDLFQAALAQLAAVAGRAPPPAADCLEK